MAEAPRIAQESDSLVAAQAVAERLSRNIESVVLGKHEEIALVLSALASGGHVLLEDVPGTAKTILARAIAQSIEGTTFARIQCTPDLQPTDVTGLSIYNQKSREFEFRAGPIFANIVLVDEINRAMPRTQSALLEAMAERQVTVDGVTRELPAPFLVIATENPIEQEGTFPLPEAQLDRFALRSALGYPSQDEEVDIVVAQRHGHPLATLESRVGRGGRRDAPGRRRGRLRRRHRARVDRRPRPRDASRWRASRPAPPSAAASRSSAPRARWALLQGRDHVVPADVERLFLPVLGHRLLLTASFVAETRSLGRARALQTIMERCLELAPPPAPNWDASPR